MGHWEERVARESPGLAYVEFLEEVRTSPNGCFGVKAHASHLPALLRHIPAAALANRFSFVRILRQAKVAQAVSWAIAEQTGAWIAEVPASTNELRYDALAIARRLKAITQQEAMWDRWLGSLGVPVLTVIHEVAVRDPSAAVQAVASFLEIPVAPLRPTETTSQRRAVNREWAARFKVDSLRDDVQRELLGPPPRRRSVRASVVRLLVGAR